MKHIFNLILLFILVGCNVGSLTDDPVEVTSFDATKTISISLDGVSSSTYDLGEFVNGSDPAIFNIDIRNNTEAEIFDIQSSFTDVFIDNFKFAQDSSFQNVFPGEGGTCQTTLASGSTCRVVIQFSSSISGIWQQSLDFKFKTLVESKDALISLRAVSGFGADLAFNIEQNFFTFGVLTGSSNTPLVERSEEQTFNQRLIVENRGDLTARNIVADLTQTCNDREGTSCIDTSILNAYSFNHDCPLNLSPGETCEVEVLYEPKNQDLETGSTPEYFDFIRYDSRLTFDYEQDPLQTPAALNTRFNSVSASIQASFISSVDEVDFIAPVIAGNRTSRFFSFFNNGLREGKAIAYNIYNKAQDTHIAKCIKEGTDEFLTCFKPAATLTEELTLEEFPFVFKDVNSCMKDNANEDIFVQLEVSCPVEVFFQPSTKLTGQSNILFEYFLNMEYDSFHLGQATIKETPFLDLRGTAITNARIIARNLTMAGNEITIDDESSILEEFESTESINIDFDTHNPFWGYKNDGDSIESILAFHLGRVAIQSSSSFIYHPFSLVVENIGGASANVVSIKDEFNTIIPLDGNVANLGPHSPTYYLDITANQLTCPVILSGSSCTISGEFAVISLGPGALTQETENFGFSAGEQKKVFSIEYDNGATYPDSNKTRTDILFPNAVSNVQIEADLVRQGVLAQVDTSIIPQEIVGKQNFDFGVLTEKEKRNAFLIYQNVGTKNIPYITISDAVADEFQSVDTWQMNAFVKVDETADPTDYGVTKNCADYFDFRGYSTDKFLNLSEPERSWQPLPENELCVLVFEAKKSNIAFSFSPANFPAISSLENTNSSLWREYNIGPDALSDQLYEFGGVNGIGLTFDFSVNYYNGDLSDPTLPTDTDELENRFGKINTDTIDTIGGRMVSIAKIIPANFKPLSSAMLYRPSFNLGTINADFDYLLNGNSVTIPFLSSSAYSEEFFYGEVVENSQNVNLEPFITSYYSSSFDFASESSGYEYVLYHGKIPTLQNDSLIFNLVNAGGARGLLQEVSLNILSGTGFNLAEGALSNSDADDVAFSSGSSHLIQIDFNADAFEGIFVAELVYKYASGFHELEGTGEKVLNVRDIDTGDNTPNIIEKKIKIIFETVNDAPSLSLSYKDYNVKLCDPADLADLADPLSPCFSGDFSNPLESLVRESLDNVAGATNVNLGFNHAVDGSMAFNFIEDNEISINDIYQKRQITLKNNSTTKTMNKLDYFFVTDGSAGTSDFDASIEPFDLIGAYPDPIILFGSPESTCDFGPSFSLAPQQECVLDIRFRPSQPMSENLIFKLVYEIDGDRYVNQAARMSFISTAPATLVAPSLDPAILQLDNGNVLDGSYDIELGNIQYTSSPFEVEAQIIEVVNSSTETKASFLAAFHNLNPLEDLPTNYENIGPHSMALIHEVAYAGGAALNRIEVYATQSCLIGTDTALSANDESGFLAADSCFLGVRLNMNADYMGLTIDRTIYEIIKDNFFTLPYYNNKRQSQAEIAFHFSGTIFPDTTVSGGGVESVFINSRAETSFEWPDMSPANNLNGGNGIVAYFVAAGKSLAEVEGAILNPTVDGFRVNLTGGVGNVQFAEDLSLILNTGDYGYLKIYAIRSHSDFTQTAARYPLLGGGNNEYLSETDLPVFNIVRPPSDLIFDYNSFSFIQPNVDSTFRNYADSLDYCDGLFGEQVTNVNSLGVQRYRLMTDAVWNELSRHSSELDTGWQILPHWIESNEIDIDDEFAFLGGLYSDQAQTGFYPDEPAPLFYFLAGTANRLTRQTRGGIRDILPEGSLDPAPENVKGYISEVLPFGLSRCYIPLPQ